MNNNNNNNACRSSGSICLDERRFGSYFLMYNVPHRCNYVPCHTQPYKLFVRSWNWYVVLPGANVIWEELLWYDRIVVYLSPWELFDFEFVEDDSCYNYICRITYSAVYIRKEWNTITVACCVRIGLASSYSKDDSRQL